MNLHKTDFVFTWFTDYHSPILTVFAKLYGKPVYSVIGGYEVELLPQFGYGGIKNPLRKRAIQFSLNRVACLFPVSDYTEKRTRELIKHDRIQKIYNGISIDQDPQRIEKDGNIFITVAHIQREQNLYIKGIPRFFAMARAFPEDVFIFIGGGRRLIEDYLPHIPPNVEIVRAQSRENLNEWYRKARFYVQLSEVESFGLAVLEAASWGAVPIVSNRGALPELFGEIGIVMDIDHYENELNTLSAKLEQPFDQEKIRKWIRRFDLQKRQAALKEYVLNRV